MTTVECSKCSLLNALVRIQELCWNLCKSISFITQSAFIKPRCRNSASVTRFFWRRLIDYSLIPSLAFFSPFNLTLLTRSLRIINVLCVCVCARIDITRLLDAQCWKLARRLLFNWMNRRCFFFFLLFLMCTYKVISLHKYVLPSVINLYICIIICSWSLGNLKKYAWFIYSSSPRFYNQEFAMKHSSFYPEFDKRITKVCAASLTSSYNVYKTTTCIIIKNKCIRSLRCILNRNDLSVERHFKNIYAIACMQMYWMEHLIKAANL